MAEPMTADWVVDELREAAPRNVERYYRYERGDAASLVEQYAQQRFAEVSEQLKRCRVHALNAESEAAALRAEVRNIRKELDEALGRWAP